MIWLMAFFAAALVAIHMARPASERRRLSCARFFIGLPPPRQKDSRFQWSNPLASPGFLLRLAVLLLVSGALATSEHTAVRKEQGLVGVAFLIDTSASMEARDPDGPRMDSAREQVRNIVLKTAEEARDRPVCFRIAAFDLARREIGVAGNVEEANAILNDLRPRALGTDLNLARTYLDVLGPGDETQCPVSSLVVTSDMPAPAWIDDEGPLAVSWLQAGKPVFNAGFSAISASRDPLTGKVREVTVHIRRYGVPSGPQADTSLEIRAPDNTVFRNVRIRFDAENIASETFSPNRPGLWRLKTTPGGSCAFDDEAAILVAPRQKLRVHWEPSDRTIPQLMGWESDEPPPDIAVRFCPPDNSPIPTLYVGQGYGRNRSSDTKIGDFTETGPLLNNLHFDVAESVGIDGLGPFEGFAPDMTGADGKFWIASRQDPPAAIVPGIPTNADDNPGRFSTTLFFNALGWLLKNRDHPPLYTLTTPDLPQVFESRIALHQDEGNTARAIRQFEHAGGSGDRRGGETRVPAWPPFIAAACVLFALERSLSVFGRSKWK